MGAGSLIGLRTPPGLPIIRLVSSLIGSGTISRLDCQSPIPATPRLPGEGSFFKCLLRRSILLRMMRSGLQAGHLQPVQQPAHRTLVQIDRPAGCDLVTQIGATPPDHLVALR